MTPDDFQQAWQTQSSHSQVTVNADLLLQEVQRNQRDFLATIFRRDLFEVGVALFLLPIWFYLGSIFSLPWTWYLGVPAIAWIAAFLLYYRLRYPLKESEPDEPLLECVKRSLRQVEQQIWLLRNIFWWYLLPPGISILAFFSHVAWLRSQNGLGALGRADGFLILLGVYSFLYYWNQRAVDKDLEPRRQELLTLLASLRDEQARDHTTTSSLQKSQSAGLLKWLILTGLCVVALVLIPLTGQLFEVSYDHTPRSSGPAGDILAGVVADLRKEKNLVGLAAMVTVDGQVEAAAVQGERKKGTGIPLEIEDRWHLGGIAKSVTATMIARLIEAGQMDWSDTVGEIFPEASIHEDWKLVTLKQLLTDTAGAPRNFPYEVLRERPALGPNCTEARQEAVLKVMADKPLYPPGKQFAYSNVGYPIAAAMAEKVTGETWENLVRQEVFEPLKLTDVGFRPPQSPDKTLPQPRGHHAVHGWKISVDDVTDNTAVMAPSGIVHMTLRDLCTYAEEHLRGELGQGTLLSAETYKLLHTPEHDRYGCGWIRRDPTAEIPYTAYWHNGSNTMWYALVVFIPEKNMVIAVTANDGDFKSAEAAALEIVKASANDFKVEGNPSSGASAQPVVYPKKSPFAAVRWQQSQPEVKVGEEWFKLISLDGIAAEDIVAFSQRTFDDKWRKRFEEDFVELLTRMGHPPQDKVTLVVQSLTTSETQTLEGVPLTEANRRAIKAAAQSPPSLLILFTNFLQKKLVEQHERELQRETRPSVPIDDAALFRTRIDEFLNTARTTAGFSGAVLVARGGEPVYKGALGFSHLDSKAPNTLDTPFRIASLSKQFTAAAILRLEADGKLDIDDPVHKYLPEFAEAPYKDITIHHLLTHTSGLPRIATGFWGPYRWNAMSQAATPVDDYVRLAVEMPLEFEPGTDFEYSNFGYRVLAALIARVAKREYADFMEEEIFQPLGMKNTGVARVDRPSSEARIAEGLSFLKLDPSGQPQYADGEGGRNFGAGYGSGGIFTSANDLLRWDRALAGDEFLSKEQKSRLFQPIHDYYACGWIVKKSGLDGRLYQMHSGGNEGFFSQMMRIPEDDLVIIALGNVDGTSALDEVIEQLFRLCRSLPYRDP